MTRAEETPGGDAPTARELLDRALTGPPFDAAGHRLVCIDGLAGAGKTTLAHRLELAAADRGLTSVVVHTDDLLAGWGGLLDLGRTLLDDVVTPLREGTPAGYRRYDWDAGAFAEHVAVPACDVVVLEGCGSAPPGVDGVAALVVYVEAPDDLRLARGLARDGEAMRSQWVRWMEQERRLGVRDRTRERADVVVDHDGVVVLRR